MLDTVRTSGHLHSLRNKILYSRYGSGGHIRELRERGGGQSDDTACSEHRLQVTELAAHQRVEDSSSAGLPAGTAQVESAGSLLQLCHALLHLTQLLGIFLPCFRFQFLGGAVKCTLQVLRLLPQLLHGHAVHTELLAHLLELQFLVGDGLCGVLDCLGGRLVLLARFAESGLHCSLLLA